MLLFRPFHATFNRIDYDFLVVFFNVLVTNRLDCREVNDELVQLDFLVDLGRPTRSRIQVNVEESCGWNNHERIAEWRRSGGGEFQEEFQVPEESDPATGAVWKMAGKSNKCLLTN